MWATWSIGTKAAVSHRKIHPSDPDRNLADFPEPAVPGQGPVPPGTVLLRPGAGRPRPGGGGRRPVGKTFWLRGRAGRKPAAGLPGPFRLLSPPGKAGGRLRRPGKGPSPWSAPGGALLRFGGLFLPPERTIPPRAFWYEAALTRPRQDQSGGLCLPGLLRVSALHPAVRVLLPHGKPCPLERVQPGGRGAYKPDDPAYLYNERFFRGQQ